MAFVIDGSENFVNEVDAEYCSATIMQTGWSLLYSIGAN